MKKGIILTFLLGIILGACIIYIVQNVIYSGQSKAPFVSMTQVFQECKIRDKYEVELKKMETESNQKLVVFENQIRGLKEGNTSEVSISSMEKELLKMRDVLSEEYQQKSESFERIIWENINKKVSEYGKENGLDYIFGANGDGTMMYASESNDITKEIIEYINK